MKKIITVLLLLIFLTGCSSTGGGDSESPDSIGRPYSDDGSKIVFTDTLADNVYIKEIHYAGDHTAEKVIVRVETLEAYELKFKDVSEPVPAGYSNADYTVNLGVGVDLNTDRYASASSEQLDKADPGSYVALELYGTTIVEQYYMDDF